MNIASAKYYTSPLTNETSGTKATIDGVEMFVPLAPGNRHYRELLEQGIEIAPYVEPAPTADQVRSKRNALLTASDWTQVADAPVDQEAWATYRQELRDIPQQEGFPVDINWPAEPE